MNGIKQVSLAFPIVELKGRKKTYEETSKALREMPNARLLWQLTKESKVRKGKRCSEFHEVWDLREVVGEDDLSIYRLWQAFKVSVPLYDVINEFEQPTEVRADHYFKADGNLDACHIDAWFNESDDEEGTMVATVYENGRIEVEERNLDIWNTSTEVQNIAFKVREEMLK